MNTFQKITELLKEKIDVAEINVEDESQLHQNHPGAVQSGGGHYRLRIVSKDFEGVRLLERHRMVYEALKELNSEIHALAIKAYTPVEAAQG